MIECKNIDIIEMADVFSTIFEKLILNIYYNIDEKIE
jgi:hypothetical protein